MQPIFFCQQFFHCLTIHFVGDTAVDGANGGTLGFFMESLALGTFVGNDVVDVDADGRIALTGIDDGTIEQGKGAFNTAAIGYSPFYTAFVDGIVGALGLAGAAVDAFFCYLDSHFCEN